ncbi:hypothetical protein [Variovorax saccharolyticus]|uniref:hypothetical protein n=1 Tax=Variovorax saccharolyticus TaxID=3053516 RepID=UPI002579226E|nr:hypothetical protein [Variovorax sp. J31P216]MDM0024101.1 hypothetical protein [Variovorax sp. J31P216]
MTRDHATQILDAVRTGRHLNRISSVTIRKALRLTGDLPKPYRVPSSRRMPNYGATR